MKGNWKHSYKEAGVDIDAGNALVERIKPLASATTRTGCVSGIGGFGGLFDLNATGKYTTPLLVAATDGVGTKLRLAIDTGIHDTVGIDLVAMCVNDLVVQGAEPLFFLDYAATGALDVDQMADVITGIAEGCRQTGCALIGGETAEMPGMYGNGDYDLAGFAVGVVEQDKLLPRTADIQNDDVILGLASSGVHSNGFSLVRRLLEAKGAALNDAAPFAEGQSFGEALLAPTRIYVQSCLAAIATGQVKALAHITGGGLLENIPRILPDTLAAQLDPSSWQMPPVFDWLRDAGNLDDTELWRTFNAGIGMAVIVNAEAAEQVSTILQQAGETVYTIGTVIPRSGDAVVMKSGTL